VAARAATTLGASAIQLLTLVTPLWLAGLALLPVIRWLHRGGRQRRAVPVSHLGLWRGSAASSPAVGERRPPDPAWRRRALLAALLFVALSEPRLPSQRIGITLWVDDSLSTLTREATGTRGTRLGEGVAQARALLAELPHADIEVRTLSDPWLSLGTLTDATVVTIASGAGRKAPAVPPAALLRTDNLHWMVTDGANAKLFEWPGKRRPDRIVQVGSVTRNAGLERLSARRNLNDPEKIDLLLKITNGGTAAETRMVVFATAAGEITRSNHSLEAGTSVLVNASIPSSAGVRATLQPGDALAEDDEISLDLTPLRRHRVAIDSKCPAAVVAAVAAHPALAVVQENATDVRAALDCGARGAVSDVATIRLLADRIPVRPRGSVQWSSSVAASQRIRLDTERLQIAARLQAQSGDVTLLAVGEEPVIVSRAGASKLIEASLDFGSAQIARGAEIPLLMNFMFERLLGNRLLDEIVMMDRGAGASRVVPSPGVGAKVEAPAPGNTRFLRDGLRPFLVAALFVMLWEIVALGREWYRLSRYVEASSE
jgi:hypothetical protein